MVIIHYLKNFCLQDKLCITVPTTLVPGAMSNALHTIALDLNSHWTTVIHSIVPQVIVLKMIKQGCAAFNHVEVHAPKVEIYNFMAERMRMKEF